jgi:hypothetical protein
MDFEVELRARMHACVSGEVLNMLAQETHFICSDSGEGEAVIYS